MEKNLINKKIHLVILGQDASILDESSEAAQRTGIYAQSFNAINVYVFAKKISKKESKYKNISVFGFSTIQASIFAFIQIYKEIRLLKKRHEVVLISTQDPFEIGLVGLLLSRITRVLLHVQIHTDISSKYMQKESVRARIQYQLSRFVLKFADRVRVVSKRIESFCVEELGLKKEKIDFVPMLYKRGVKKTLYIIGQTPQVIVLPARFVWFKRISLAIESFSMALKENKNIRLRIIGSGPLQNEIESLVKKLDVSEYVVIIPWMNAEDLYQDASLTLISSIYEGWCRVATESVEAGVPVVMTDVGCAGDFIQNSIHGAVVPIENSKAIAEAINQIFQNINLYKNLKSNCLETGDGIDSFETYQRKVVRSWLHTISQIK